MDRKSRTILIICACCMALNMWYASTQEAERQKLIAVEKAAAEKQAAVEAAKNPKPAVAPSATPATPAGAPEKKHEIQRGSVTWQFSTQGGGVARAVLAGHDQITLNTQGKEAIGSLRREAKLLDDTPYEIVEADSKHVVFQGLSVDGLLVRKTYTVTEGEASDEHLLKLQVTLTNQGKGQLVSDHHYLYTGAAHSLRPDDLIVPPTIAINNAGNMTLHRTTNFDGGWFSSERTEITQTLDALRWAGVHNRFYIHLLSTPEGKDAISRVWSERTLVDHSKDEFKDSTSKDWAVHAAMGLAPLSLEPGASTTQDFELYAGPREYHRLKPLGRQRWFSMDYGWFSMISRGFVNLMRWFHDLTGNWGWAIILLTICVRVLVWPVMAKSQKAAKRMGKLSPEIAKLKEKYADNPQQMNVEMMKLWKDYGVNPMSGCWPALIQIPIFFACLYMLQPAAELRGQDFLWVKDLSLPDTIMKIFGGFPLNPLPLLMGFTGFLQMKMMPQSPGMDKMQQRIFMFMPLMFVFFFYTFPSGLALYYTTQNLFSIFQTWIMRVFNKEDNTPLKKIVRPAAGPMPSAFQFNNPNAKPESTKPKQHVPRLGGSGSSSKGNNGGKK
jgi:YidC/Oxa1 family membrane protein insertase